MSKVNREPKRLSHKRSTKRETSPQTLVLLVGARGIGTKAFKNLLGLLGTTFAGQARTKIRVAGQSFCEVKGLGELHKQTMHQLGLSPFDWQATDPIVLPASRDLKAEISRVLKRECVESRAFLIDGSQCRLFVPWIAEAAASAGFSVVTVLVDREPDHVSVAPREGQGCWPAGMTEPERTLLWLAEIVAAEKATRGGNRTVIATDDLMADWHQVAAAVAKQTGTIFSTEEEPSARVIETSLEELRSELDGSKLNHAVDPSLQGWVDDIKIAFALLRGDPNDADALKTIDRISEEMRASRAALLRIVELIRQDAENARINVDEQAEGPISRPSALVDFLSEKNAELESSLAERGVELANAYSAYDETVAAFRNSTCWRITAPIRALKLAVMHFRRSSEPISTAVKISGGLLPSIARGVSIMRREGLEGIRWRLNRVSGPVARSEAMHVHEPNPRLIAAGQRRFNSIRFRVQPDPEVSIIIPVYNQLDYTLRCLMSLMALKTPYPFEVIVMDDGSSDDTQFTLAGVPGLIYVRNEQNLGFLRNCNKGSTIARGRYLVFLNNDTELDPDWLTALRKTFDEHENVGLVGSKLVYPDGRLQEAGGIIWEDASAWNWGRLQSPAHPSYNYVRDVDYVSGASIMIERDFFERLNRFDERYQNAYYEDTDLAMSVRAAGLRVVYQPASIVIHHEGITSGVDENGGVKRYQAINREGFYDKWGRALRDNLPNATTPHLASDRCVRGHILIVDACTPTPDQDSGSIDMFNLIKILRDEGYRVHFIPQSNFIHFGQYTDVLQAMGVECVYAPFYTSVDQYVAERGDMFDHVILARVNVAAESIDSVRRHCPSADIIFYTVDLHFLREKREAAMTGDSARTAAAAKTEKLELSIFDRADVGVVLSEVERDHLLKLGRRNVEVLPLIRDLPHPPQMPYEARQDVLFIGGYSHAPNVDAVEWLVAEIWPEVRRITAERGLAPITLHLYGSLMPERFRSFAADDIMVHGFVEDLGAVFTRIRLSVTPLRFGAGLKGKLATSFSYCVPVVGTTVAFEGVNDPAFAELQVATDQPAALAERLVDLYYDAPRWWDISGHARSFAETHYSIQAVAGRVRSLLDRGNRTAKLISDAAE